MRRERALERFKIVDGPEFIWKNRRYKVDQIKHLSFDWINTTERVYGAKAGEYQQVCLHIGLLNNQKIDIRVTEKPSFMGMSILGLKNEKKESIEEMKGLYGQLLRLSFESRLSNYLRTIETDGFMTYGKCRFWPKEKTIYYKNRAFVVAETKITKIQRFIKMEPTTSSGLKGVRKTAVFDSSKDPDILFAVLDKWFDIRWPD